MQVLSRSHPFQVLLSIGYVWLDVRPTSEVERRGKIRDSTCIPFVIESRKFDPMTVRMGSLRLSYLLHNSGVTKGLQNNAQKSSVVGHYASCRTRPS